MYMIFYLLVTALALHAKHSQERYRLSGSKAAIAKFCIQRDYRQRELENFQD